MSRKSLAMAIIIVILLLTGGVFSYQIWVSQEKSQSVTKDNQEVVNETVKAGEASVPKSNQDTSVEWYAQPREIIDLKLYKKDNELGIYKAWETGKFIKGDNVGKKIVLVAFDNQDPSGFSTFRFLEEPDRKTLEPLSRYSSSNFFDRSDGYDREVYNEDLITSNFVNNESIISSLDFPGSIQLANGVKLVKKEDYPLSVVSTEAGYAPNYLDGIFFKNDFLKKVATDPVYGDIYTTDDSKNLDYADEYSKHGFYIKAPDGTFKVYSLDIDFMGSNDVPDVIWNGGSKAGDPYSFQGFNGCGSGVYLDVADKEFKAEDLVEIGKTVQGDPIYGTKDINNEFLRKWYEENKSILADFEGTWENLKFDSRWSYEEFMNHHPMFLWRDSFGRLIRFMNSKLVVAGGCGKPVIYLYPEKTMPVSVQVEPTGGITISDPAYGQGWQVISDPHSNIRNLADGKIYPYLFWEGRANEMYQMPRYGFVFSKDELDEKLNEKLLQFGLNQKEANDFKEFWLPKMMEEKKPYYFVTFVSQEEIDKLAPLNINPKPDTVIRVLMDYKGLDQKENVQGFKIKTPARKGFTAVEWGGVLK